MLPLFISRDRQDAKAPRIWGLIHPLWRLGVLAISPLVVGCGDNKTHPDQNAPYEAGSPAPLACVPNLDGRIDATELQPVLNTPVKYLVSPAGAQRPVDVAGTVDGSGKRTWGFGVALADDQTVKVQATALAGKWYAASFPSGQFTTPFDAAQTLDAVYTQDASGLFLLGLASKDPAPPEGKTLYVYSPAIQALKFPLTVGTSWVSVGTITNGTLRGLPYAGQDTYEISDDATGELVIPDLTFTQAHRVREKVTLAPAAGQTVVTRQVSFFFECFGEVTRATSNPGETNDDFTTAAEVRRFGP
jgi:hypothetical protein